MTDQAQAGLLNNLLEELLKGSGNPAINTGDLDEEHRALYQNILRLVEKQTQFGFESQATAGKIKAASEELWLTVEQNNRTSAELSGNILTLNELNESNLQSVAEAVGQTRNMIDFMQSIGESSRSIKSANQQTEKVLNDGMSRVYDLIGLIDGINQTSEKTASLAEQLAQSTSKISAILKNVNDIARQTEILAFNATVESRRAGNEGRGFGVIASSIRDLADESKHEVAEISDVIESINGGLDALNDSIEANATNVSRGVGHSKDIQGSLSEMEDSYGRVSSIIDTIIEISGREDLLAKDITEKINALEENAEKIDARIAGIGKLVEGQRNDIGGLSDLAANLLSSAESMLKLTGNAVVSLGYDKTMIAGRAKQAFSLLKQTLLGDRSFCQLLPAQHKQMIDKLFADEKKAGGIFESLWTNNPDGHFIYSNPPAGIANARSRDWFKHAANRQNYVSDIYISAITKKPCVTVSMPILSPDGSLAGVLGADLRL